MSVTATFSFGTLNIFGDRQNNTIAISRDAAGQLLVNGGAVSISGGTATVANTVLISAFGFGGNDTISINDTNGVLPRTTLFGGGGNDVLTGGSGNDRISGQAGNDTLSGLGGRDVLLGGTEDDVLVGGDGNDRVLGNAGNDRLIWNPGDDTDLNEGDTGTDTIEVNGGNGDETFAVTANGSRVRFDRLNSDPFSLDIGTSENLVVNMNGGNDRFSTTGDLAALIKITVDGGAGDDNILGSNGADLLLGGDGNDVITGGDGDDVAFLGAGDDTFIWNPGDDNDTLEGQAGRDTMLFNGANIAEQIDIFANGGRVRFFRNVASVLMDTDDLEVITFNALGGADNVVVNDLSGTDVTDVQLNLGGNDGAADTVTVNSTAGDDTILAAGNATTTQVLGLAAIVTITEAEPANDRLVINTGAGDDVVEASGLKVGAIQLTADGGDGADVLVGGDGNDILRGGAGDDVLIGNAGIDALDGGTGDNIQIQ